MGFNRDQLLSHVQDQHTRQVLAKVVEKAEIVLRRDNIETTDFLDPYQLELARGILRSLNLTLIEGGAYPAAERRKLALRSTGKVLSPGDLAIGVLQVQGGSELCRLSHRDYLGSLLALGLRQV